MNIINDEDDYFSSNVPENITDTNASIDSSSPITIMPELLVDTAIEISETDAVQTSSSQSNISFAQKGGTLKKMKVEGMSYGISFEFIMKSSIKFMHFVFCAKKM